MFLLALSLLYLLFEIHHLVFVLVLTSVQLFNIVQVYTLSLYAAHLLPDTKCLIHKLLVQSVRASQQEFLGQLVSLNKEAPRLEAVIE